MGHCIDIKDVSMVFGDVKAISNLDIHINEGEFFSFLGPSGCGKTTLLKLISGFLEPTCGRILIDNKDMKGVGPNRRPTAMIFQNLALFPLMSVEENLSFGLEVRRIPKRERDKKIDELLELVDLKGTKKARVTELSGGQRQRIAIARALAVEPSVLLLDEPLSALDLKLRKHMRFELREIQKKTGLTFVYITHDQSEALSMSDRVGVISEEGVLEQVDTPLNIYNKPETHFVASFVGENNMIPAKITKSINGSTFADTSFGKIECVNPGDIDEGKEGQIFIRPEKIGFANGYAHLNNCIIGKVVKKTFEGAHVTLIVEACNRELKMRYNNDGKTPDIKKDEEIKVEFTKENTIIL